MGLGASDDEHRARAVGGCLRRDDRDGAGARASFLPLLPCPARPALPADPVVGNWRGTLTSASGVESPIIITIVKKGDSTPDRPTD